MIPRHAHKRSISSGHRSLSPDRTVPKAKSTTNLAEIANQEASFEGINFNTLRDPRLAIGQEVSESTSSQSHHPDLSNEVAALSVKLIQAINNQTQLDDSLAAAHQELEQAQGKVQALEFQNEKYKRDINEQVYIRKSDADREILQLRTAFAEERAQRTIAEKAKKNIETELETLTAALFEEANKMVAAAKIEREAVEKKNEQLRSQIKDTELLLASHQDQLAELKSVMQGMNLSRDDVDAPTAPPSPAGPAQLQGSAKGDSEIEHVPVASCIVEELTPGPCASFPQMIRMVCRTDLQAFEDFRELLTISRSSKPPSRAASGHYAGLNVMSLANFTGSGSVTSSPTTKGALHSPNGSMSSQTGPSVPLKETRFYKRVLMEDIEPTLRLDAAPGISWLTRRAVLSGICEGSLLVEPMPLASKKYEFPCSVCGERRPGPHNERTHRFRTSDSETAQRYSLCRFCLERVRSACEFTGYLRLILDGHIRAGDSEEEKEVWEETIRLRERMFWSRVGAGIVPLFTQPEADTTESNSAVTRDNQEGHGIGPHLKVLRASGSLPVVPVLGETDVPSPRNLDLERKEPSLGTKERRPSVDSEDSIYEEANADVAIETAKSAAEAVKPAEATVGTAEPLVPQSPSGPDHDTTNILTRSDS
ncbi:hypothetical protein N7510_000885 [Penicillium lagena]|uniref:uncharacterized protein n=1 Tax=Penicillium lagena TaxID=94218 RepID=UPI002540E09A|nr:uncharacterized protein N7510_000885 [Penicillium lagena]KAJ5624576.1 hypothetical protein N7510_000885 [Penicillium lagena]